MFKYFTCVDLGTSVTLRPMWILTMMIITTLYRNPINVFLFWELRGLSPNFHIHVSVTDLYIPRIGPHISWNRIDRSMVGIYKSLTDSIRNSFSGNICYEFSILCQILQTENQRVKPYLSPHGFRNYRKTNRKIRECFINIQFYISKL